MKDSEWESKMKQCVKACNKYYSLLQEIEGEFELRYGIQPSDMDNDSWIDSFHGPVASEMSIKQIEETVEWYWKRHTK